MTTKVSLKNWEGITIPLKVHNSDNVETIVKEWNSLVAKLKIDCIPAHINAEQRHAFTKVLQWDTKGDVLPTHILVQVEDIIQLCYRFNLAALLKTLMAETMSRKNFKATLAAAFEKSSVQTKKRVIHFLEQHIMANLDTFKSLFDVNKTHNYMDAWGWSIYSYAIRDNGDDKNYIHTRFKRRLGKCVNLIRALL